jgi:2,3-bisphosphoglycerate-independent phosphoglycerate mutase
MHDGDVAFRCNLVHLDLRGTKVFMGDHSAGHITTEEAKAIIKDLGESIGNETLRFFPGVSYRHLMLWDGGKSEMVTHPPHDILEKEVVEYMPTGEGSDTIIRLMNDSQMLLKDHPVNRERLQQGLLPANSIWLWGQGKKPYFPTFFEKHQKRGGVVAAVDLVKGIGALAGFETPHVEGATGYLDTDYVGKARKALELLERYDIVYVHIEAPDEASHSGNLSEKVKAIESVDEKVVGYLLDNVDENVRLLVVTDHATPVSMRTHYACPVPFVIFEKGQRLGGGAYQENNGGTIFTGEEMIRYFLKGLES